MSKKQENNKSSSNKKEKSISLKQKIFILIPIIALISIILVFFFIQSTDNVSAQLIIDYGTVEVQHNGGSWAIADNGMLLYQSDTIRTGNNTYASIILFEGSIIRLDNNTVILIKELIQVTNTINVSIEQETGRTWNTVQRISGIDNYQVQTPTTIASVRGTTFDVNVTGQGSTNISVINGTVNISRLENGVITDTIQVEGNKSVFIDPVTPEIVKKDFIVKDEWILRNLVEDKKLFEQLKTELYSRLEPYIPELKERYQMTDEELEVLINAYIKGYIDLPPDTPQWIRDIIEIT